MVQPSCTYMYSIHCSSDLEFLCNNVSRLWEAESLAIASPSSYLVACSSVVGWLSLCCCCLDRVLICIYHLSSCKCMFYYKWLFRITIMYSVPHEESELMLGMYDVTSIATIHWTWQNGHQKPAFSQSEVALVAVYASRDARWDLISWLVF